MNAYRSYPKYSESGSEWLGALPNHWGLLRAKFLFKKRAEEPQADDGIVTAFRDGQVTLRTMRRTEGFTNALQEIGYQRVYQGDLVLHAMDAFAGAIGVSEATGKCSPVYSVCMPWNSEKCLMDYYGRLLRFMALSGFVESLAKGIRERSTDFRFADFKELSLPVPPLPEQIQIASFLDRECGKLDALQAKQERLIELLKEKRQALIGHAVTRGLDPTAKLKPSGIEWLGDVPEHWAVRKLGLIGTFKGGAGFPDEHQGQTENEIPFFKVGDIVNSDGMGVMRQANHTITRETAKLLRAFIFPSGTVVFAKVGAALLLKRFRTLGQSSCIDNNMMGMTVGKDTLADFLIYVLPLLDFELIVNPGAVPSINEGQISSQRIALPPLAEQRAIVEHLDDKCGKIDQLVAKAERGIELLKERRSALISAAVTGKIDVR